MATLHQSMVSHPATGWACLILRCDTDERPSACVLLIVSVAMLTLAMILLVP